MLYRLDKCFSFGEHSFKTIVLVTHKIVNFFLKGFRLQSDGKIASNYFGKYA